MSKKKPIRKTKASQPASRPDLRKKLANAIENGGEFARGFRRHFAAMSDRDVTFGEWPAIKTDLDRWTKKAQRVFQRVTSAIDEIAGSQDANLKADAAIVRQLGYTKQLEAIYQSLDDQLREARAPLTADHKRRFSQAIADLVIKASVLDGIAKELAAKIEMARPTPAPDIHDPLRPTCDTLGQLVEATLKFATAQKSSKTGMDGGHLAASLKAVSDYEIDLDAAEAALLKQADDLKKQKQFGWEQEVRALAKAIRSNSTFQLAIISTTEDSLLAAAQPSKAADAAASKLIAALKKLRSRFAKTLVVCKAAGGVDEGGGDCADPATISEYGDLTPTETVVVDYFRRLAVEGGKTKSVRIDDVITSVWPKLQSAGLASSDATIREVVKRLSDASRNILHSETGGRLSGHGGAKFYRLTFVAADKFPRWNGPSGHAPTAAAPGQGTKSGDARRHSRKASSR